MTYIHHVAAFVFTVILFVVMSLFGGSMLSPKEVSRLRDTYAGDYIVRQEIDTRDLPAEALSEYVTQA